MSITQSIRRHRVGALVLPLAAAVTAAAGVALWVAPASALRPPQRAAGAAAPAPAPAAAAAPVRVDPTAGLPGVFDASEVDEVVARLRLKRPPSMATMLHAVRLFGPEVAYPLPDSGREERALDVALDVGKGCAVFGGKPALIATRHGVRGLLASKRDGSRHRGRQVHVDQILAVLAEVGVPLTRPVTTEAGPTSVRAMLDESLANFETSQEIEWTAMALALYLPPRRSWSDKFGRRHDFDGLATELLGRPLDDPEVACAGTHMLYSMAVLARADEAAPVLSPPVRRKVRDRLAEMAAKAVSRQNPDGSWDVDWPKDGPHDHDHEAVAAGEPDPNRVLATGHQLEWLFLLPRDQLPPEGCVRKAAGWLRAQVLAAPARTIAENYCPYSHAAKVLKALTKSGPSHGRIPGTRGVDSREP
jgi:hypothetical protein